MTSHKDKELFPTAVDVDPRPDLGRGVLRKVRTRGAYPSLETLYEVHIDLLAEDFLCSLSDQINEIRTNPELLQTANECYRVTSVKVHTIQRGRSIHLTGIEFHFDASRYEGVDWEEEKRLMRNNLVYLTQDNLKTFIVGVVHEGGQRLLEKGCVVVNLVKGVKPNGFFEQLELDDYLNQTFDLVEGKAFHFPYHIVTRVLRREMKLVSMRRDLGLQYCLAFEDEVVHCTRPSRPPGYLGTPRVGDSMRRLLLKLQADLNPSQRLAMKSVLMHRVALVQGPPGTGKTFLGCKVVQLFVQLKEEYPLLFKGPILLVTTTNHAVQEFLRRCSEFTDKIIHCCSDKHERDRHWKGALQLKHDKAPRAAKDAVLMEADLIAMTTTRAACIRQNLDVMDIKIMIVEEAGEALEGHILACIPVGTDHLIQIGDHKQLRPSLAHEDMGPRYNLDISLFERLIENDFDCVMLNEQRRMRPAIAKLVECFYDDLTNHPCTLGRPPLTGVDLDEPVFFLNHGGIETQEGSGYINRVEAEVAVELTEYLMKQGYEPGSITVLTTYRRQLRLILELLAEKEKEKVKVEEEEKGKKKEEEEKKILATTVDSFQGEENDIIILSLVRSNASGKIGFLKMANRACVALSRARNGFIMLGNLPCLVTSAVPVWVNVDAVLSPEGLTGSSLPLVCRHGRRFPVTTAADVRVAAKGCGLCQGRPTPGPEVAMPSMVRAERESDLGAAERSLANVSARLLDLDLGAGPRMVGTVKKVATEASVERLRTRLDAEAP